MQWVDQWVEDPANEFFESTNPPSNSNFYLGTDPFSRPRFHVLDLCS